MTASTFDYLAAPKAVGRAATVFKGLGRLKPLALANSIGIASAGPSRHLPYSALVETSDMRIQHWESML